MTDKEIIKALEDLIENFDGKAVDFMIISVALNLINRLQAEKQDLEIKLKAMREAANSYKAENEMLKKDSKDIDEFARNICKERLLQGKAIADFDSLQRYIKQQKAEAYKECIEKVREKLDDCRTVTDYVYQGYDTGDIRNMLDNLVKEMVGENNG